MNETNINKMGYETSITLHMSNELKNTFKRLANINRSSLQDTIMGLVLSGLRFDENLREQKMKMASKIINVGEYNG